MLEILDGELQNIPVDRIIGIGKKNLIEQLKSILMNRADKMDSEQSDGAMMGDVIEHKTQVTSHTTPGGIDLNEIEVDRQGVGVDIQFDPAAMEPMLNMQIDGFAPVIINFIPIPSVLPLLGLEPRSKDDELEVSSLN